VKKEHIYQSDVVIIGGGLSGLAAASDMLDHNMNVIVLDRDRKEKLGGLAKDSFGGVMMVDTPLQKRSGIRDNPDLALSDWLSTADFKSNDSYPLKWAELYVNSSREMIYDWLTKRSVRFMPVVNWPERGLFKPGNSVPRWHIVWGTGYKLMESVIGHLNAHKNRKKLRILYEHCASDFILENQTVTGCSGSVEPGGEPFKVSAGAVVAASGGICGGDLSMVRKNWYKPWGNAPSTLLNGSHRFADGLIHERSRELGANLTHLNRQWHYAAGIHHPEPELENQGLSLVPPRSALWVNAHGKRIGPVPLVSYTDTRYLVEEICKQPGQYSWQIMNWKIAIKELGVSGSEYMTAFRHEKRLKILMDILFGNKELVNRLISESEDIVTAGSVQELAEKMNQLPAKGTGDPIRIDPDLLEKDIGTYDACIDRGMAYFNDYQLARIAEFRQYRGDRIRTCKFQKINDPKAMPLIAIREFILSRKSLGGIQTDLKCRVLKENGDVIPGLYAVGETAGFGGGGIHGKGSLEGTFLGSCILTGRAAASHIAKG